MTTSHIGGNNYITIQWIYFTIIFWSIPFSSIKFAVIVKRKKAGPSQFWLHQQLFFDLELFWSACTSWLVEVWACFLRWLRRILQYRCTEYRLSDTTIDSMDCIHTTCLASQVWRPWIKLLIKFCWTWVLHHSVQ